MYLIDTNVISEIRKGRRCDPKVAAWFRQVQDDDLYLSVLVIGEIRQEIERVRARDLRKARALEDWLEQLLAGFAERILKIDDRVAQEWGRLSARGGYPVIDALLAATAMTHNLTPVTGNLKGVERYGARCLNPFEFEI